MRTNLVACWLQSTARNDIFELLIRISTASRREASDTGTVRTRIDPKGTQGEAMVY